LTMANVFEDGEYREMIARLLPESQRSAVRASPRPAPGVLTHAEVQLAVFAQVIIHYTDHHHSQQNYCNDFPVQDTFLLCCTTNLALRARGVCAQISQAAVSRSPTSQNEDGRSRWLASKWG
jgi:hypothetical protein